MNRIALEGLIVAAHTPFTRDGDLALGAVETQAAHYLAHGLTTVFVAGSTGESHSLSFEERRQLTTRWMEVIRGERMRVVVHVGSNCLVDARALAAHAQAAGAAAIAALAPSYFRPQTADTLVDCCADIAAGAPELPFYFYDIPALTGVNLSMPEFLERGAARIPTLSGIKWTNPDLCAYQSCLHAPGKFDMPWGNDEYLLAALAVGARGAVGSSYAFAARVYQRLLSAFAAGDMAGAQAEQYRSVQLIRLLAGYGYLGAAKAVMGMLGVDVGPARLPNSSLGAEQAARLRGDLERLGFFEWIVPGAGERPC
jgi:N-acetylneuraminate lyase